jgi:hypothetical protein
MTLLTFALIQLAAIILATIAAACFRPSWVKSIAAFLVTFADAIQAARAVFQGTESKSTPAKLQPITGRIPYPESEAAADVFMALVAQGAKKAEAEKKVSIALSALGPNANFDELWRKAVAA